MLNKKSIILLIAISTLVVLVLLGIYYFKIILPSRLKLISSSQNDKGRYVIYESSATNAFPGYKGVYKGRDYKVLKFEGWTTIPGSVDKYLRVSDMEDKSESSYRVMFRKEAPAWSDGQVITNISVENLTSLQAGIGSGGTRIGSADELLDKMDSIIKPGDTLVLVKGAGNVNYDDKGVEVAMWIIVRRYFNEGTYN